MTFAACDHEPHIGFPLAEGAHGVGHNPRLLGRTERQFEPERARAELQAGEVLFEPKDATGAHPNALEQAVPVEQAVIEHGNLGLCFGHYLPID